MLPSRTINRKSSEDTTSIEGLREISLYYTVDDGRNITLHQGVLRVRPKGGYIGVSFRGYRHVLHLKELALSDDIGDLRRGKDVCAYISDNDGLDGHVVLFTLFGNKEVACSWIAERKDEYRIARQR